MTHYIAAIHKDPDSDYGVSFPDFPGCVSAGATMEEAVDQAQEALALHCSEIIEAGTMPTPSSLEQVARDPDYQDATLVLIAAPTKPPEVRRINVTLPDDLVARIDTAAQREGFTRSGWLAHVSRRALSREPT